MMKFHYCEFKTPDAAREFFAVKQLDGWKLLCDIFVTQWGQEEVGEDQMVAYPAEFGAVFYTDESA